MSIKVYTKSNCPNCVKAKNILNSFHMLFEEIDIEKESKARDFLVSEGHRSVPQIYADDTLIGGVNNLSREKLLNFV